MGKVIKLFEEEPRKPERRPLTEEELKELLKPLEEGLLRLYPSQVKAVNGLAAVGQVSGDEKLLGGLLFWESKKGGPAVSTFIALFKNDRLEKISFYEAKRNYWDWEVTVKSLKERFDAEEVEKAALALRERFFGGQTGK
ncbi:MAG: hypothetical protein GXO03_00065 [Aquificae bacterium]|nr:hypothetical protein [Aquificota bacterium]